MDESYVLWIISQQAVKEITTAKKFCFYNLAVVPNGYRLRTKKKNARKYKTESSGLLVNSNIHKVILKLLYVCVCIKMGQNK